MNTDSMPDIKAMALEKAKELMDLYAQYNVPFVLRFSCVNPQNSDVIDYGGAFAFVNGKHEPTDVRLEMMRDNVAFWERQFPGLKLVAMSDATYEKLRESIKELS